MKLLISSLLLSSFLNAQIISRTQIVMGTTVTIKVQDKDEIYINNAFNIIKKVDKSLSTFKKKSIISKLNKYKKVKLDLLSFEALSLSKQYYKDTNGYFNITIGSITKDLYKFGENESIPSVQDINDAKVDLDALVFDKDKATLLESFKIDLGGMGKGFGVDKISEYFISNNISEAIVSASGDIRCLRLCTISLINPFQKKFKSTMMLSFKTKKKNLGVTTSGNYNRFVKDKTHNHLINPKTKLSAQNFASITLVGSLKSSALDAYATAISVMPKDKAYKFLDNLNLGYIVVEVGGKSVVKPCGFFDLVSSE